MEFSTGVHRVLGLDFEVAKRQAEDAGFTTFVLPADGIVDRASFFDAVRNTFPLDPPLAGNRSWDALSDSLWEGLYTDSGEKFVIFWPNTGPMSRSAAADFETALNVLADVSSLLADSNATLAKPKTTAILVEGQ